MREVAQGVPKMVMDGLDPKIEVERAIEPMKEIEEVILDYKNLGKTIQIRKNFPPDVRKKIVDTIRCNQDILALCHADMSSINPNMACHVLNIVKPPPLFGKRECLWIP